jgi:uncharacterized protein with PIN domain
MNWRASKALSLWPNAYNQSSIASPSDRGRGWNIGDRFAYAQAKALKPKLPYKNDDFSMTDIEAAN